MISRNLRKKVRKDYSELFKDEYCISSDSDHEDKKPSNKSKEFRYCITDFDCCRLVENKKSTRCEIKHCFVLEQTLLTNFACKTCKISCCLECYDVHRKEKMSEAIRNFMTSYTSNSEMLISEGGKISMVPVKDDETITVDQPILEVSSHTSFEESIINLQSIFENSPVEFHFNELLNAIYFQDKQMKEFFNYFPEFISIDVTCEIIDLEYILHLFISEDSNGYCEIIAACLLKSNDPNSLLWLWNIFKKSNPCWQSIKLIFADKQTGDLNNLKSSFPDASIHISPFHAMQSFKNGLLSFNIEKTKKQNVIKLFENMIVLMNNSEYESCHCKLKELHEEMAVYFEEHWHVNNAMWRLPSQYSCKTCFSPINKYLHTIRKKMKTALNTKKCLQSFFKTFFQLIFNYRKEKYETLSVVFQSLSVSSQPKAPHYKYTKFLTHFASKLVIHQLNMISEVKNMQKLSSGKYNVLYHHNSVNVSLTNCSCNFFNILSLPCCHIFAIRKSLSLPLFVESLCSSRWILKQYYTTFTALHALFMEHSPPEYVGKHYSEDRFKKYFELCDQLVPLISNNLKNQETLDLVLNAWKYNIKVNVKSPENASNLKNEAEFDYSIDHLKDLYGVSGEEYSNSDGEFSSVSLCSENSEDELFKYLEDGA